MDSNRWKAECRWHVLSKGRDSISTSFVSRVEHNRNTLIIETRLIQFFPDFNSNTKPLQIWSLLKVFVEFLVISAISQNIQYTIFYWIPSIVFQHCDNLLIQLNTLLHHLSKEDSNSLIAKYNFMFVVSLESYPVWITLPIYPSVRRYPFEFSPM